MPTEPEKNPETPVPTKPGGPVPDGGGDNEPPKSVIERAYGPLRCSLL